MDRKGLPVNLGTENVWKLLMQYAIPSVIAMTASSLYNITDSIFIGQGVGALAISGLAISFPLMNLSAAFGTLIGAGAANLLSLRLGQKDYGSANKILGNVVSLTTILGVAYTIIVMLFLDDILRFFGASSDTLPYAKEYMTIITLGNVITHMYFGLNALIRSSGNPAKSMYATIFTVAINAILTPIFIYGFDMGIRGAAIATVLSQIVLLVWQFRFFSNKQNFIHLKRENLKIDKKILKDTTAIGLAPFLMNAVSSLIVIMINHSLVRYGGDLAVGAYGIMNRIAMLFGMVVMGLTMGMQPIAGYNYGAGLFSRVNKVLKHTIILATGVITTGFLIGELIPREASSLFTTDKALLDLAVPGMRIAFAAFPIIGFQMVSSNFFQSIGKPGMAIYMSLSRQVIFLIPALLILPNYLGIYGVWLSFPVADTLAAVNSAFILTLHFKKIKS
ncbi:MAG: MATE family efflux transporter [Bacteroidales bacterium]|jgi:putative MATE family efflux protein|nr:MATE family efflux transporter [Bacteroidales bacterium]